MTGSYKQLCFVWWNLQDLAHFDPHGPSGGRWPGSTGEYEAKLGRVGRVLGTLSRTRRPHLLAFAEVTDRAAHEIRDRLFPTYKVHSLASLYARPDFHLGVLYDPAAGFGGEDFLAVANLPHSARPMATLDHHASGHRIRFYACHWPARFTAQSDKSRSLSAHALELAAYEFLHHESPANEVRHVVILGDLNEEPFGLVESWLHASRDRPRARGREHYTDKAARRVRLYNCSWRLLGEQLPHPLSPEGRDAAGSYYRRDEKTWHSFDQVIVSGSLLNSSPPFLDEGRLRVACGREEFPDELLGEDGLPCKFEWNDGAPKGVSDHLPLCGSIVLA